MPRSDAQVEYEFAGFRLNPALHRLVRVSDAKPVTLAPKAFEALLQFVKRAGELLEKQELLRTVWPHAVVEENSLSQVVSTLRRALGEHSHGPRFILTVPGRGYRFTADVQRVAAAIARKSIAVLPFANLTGDATREYFSDGLAEALICALAQIPMLRVPARTSSFAYKGRNVDVREIASDLGVEAVIEGSVRSAEQRLRVTAQLIDGRTGYHLWTQSFDRPLGALLEFQDELADCIAHACGVANDEQARLPGRTSTTTDVEAYEFYLQGTALMHQRPGPQGVERAITLFQQAVARDPGFARGIAAMAHARPLYIVYDHPVAGALDAAEQDAQRALLLNPALSEAQVALATTHAARADWCESEARFRAALSCSGDRGLILHAQSVWLSASVGHAQVALSQAHEAYRLAPANPAVLMNLSAMHLIVGNDREAEHFVNRAIELGWPEHVAPVPDVTAQLAVRAGRYTHAADIMCDQLPASLKAIGATAAVRKVFAALDNSASRASAITALASVEQRGADADLSQTMSKRLMLWYTLLGALPEAFDAAFNALTRFGKIGSVGTAWGLLWIREMQPFHEHPKFTALAGKLRFPEYWSRFGPPDDRAIGARADAPE